MLQEILKVAKSIAFDSRFVGPGAVYVAIRGAKVDGHDFLSQAIDSGAVALVVEDSEKVPANFNGPVYVVDDTRKTLSELAAAFYYYPSRELFTVAVTGTNGKTTTTHLIEAIFNYAGKLTGVIGTIDHHLGEKVWPTELTTPDPVMFQRRLREFQEEGAHAVALEASSIALTQSRIEHVDYDCAVFTNLSRDHLDYHKDMEDYFKAKLRLFTDLLIKSSKDKRTAVINGQDPYGQRIIDALLDFESQLHRLGLLAIKGARRLDVWRFGFDTNHVLSAHILSQSFEGTKFRFTCPMGQQDFFLPMAGKHNVENAMAAIGAGLAAGISLEDCAEALKKVRGVNGRLEYIKNSVGLNVFVDYAHTDDALERAISSLVKIREEANLKARIITVFGCGGDRDRGKRPLMMKAALKNSDYVILTSDNPRTEDPRQIMSDALAGATDDERKHKIHTEVDRKKAIHYALATAQKGDVVIVAGKGHETYQQIGTQKFPFSDAEVVKGFAR